MDSIKNFFVSVCILEKAPLPLAILRSLHRHPIPVSASVPRWSSPPAELKTPAIPYSCQGPPDRESEVKATEDDEFVNCGFFKRIKTLHDFTYYHKWRMPEKMLLKKWSWSFSSLTWHPDISIADLIWQYGHPQHLLPWERWSYETKQSNMKIAWITNIFPYFRDTSAGAFAAIRLPLRPGNPWEFIKFIQIRGGWTQHDTTGVWYPNERIVRQYRVPPATWSCCVTSHRFPPWKSQVVARFLP